ncbi:hypothetical protein Ancab_024704 [Ancistrocladus abbreviatus]
MVPTQDSRGWVMRAGFRAKVNPRNAHDYKGKAKKGSECSADHLLISRIVACVHSELRRSVWGSAPPTFNGKQSLAEAKKILPYSAYRLGVKERAKSLALSAGWSICSLFGSVCP